MLKLTICPKLVWNVKLINEVRNKTLIIEVNAVASLKPF